MTETTPQNQSAQDKRDVGPTKGSSKLVRTGVVFSCCGFLWLLIFTFFLQYPWGSDLFSLIVLVVLWFVSGFAGILLVYAWQSRRPVSATIASFLVLLAMVVITWLAGEALLKVGLGPPHPYPNCARRLHQVGTALVTYYLDHDAVSPSLSHLTAGSERLLDLWTINCPEIDSGRDFDYFYYPPASAIPPEDPWRWQHPTSRTGSRSKSTGNRTRSSAFNT